MNKLTKDQIINQVKEMLDEGMINGNDLATQLLYWLPESSLEIFVNANGLVDINPE